jgi:lactoylglutathione lyase
MLRVRDPTPSLDFYTRIIGMDLISKHEAESFTLYFLAFDHSNGKMTAEEKDKGRFTREGVLELTWNHGTEKDESFAGYASGNEDPGKGFGHICLWVPCIRSLSSQ